MKEVIGRIEKERDELFEKVKKLTAYLDSNPEISEDMKCALYIQEDAMLTYYSCLVTRLEMMEE
ncbi:MAG: crAss001_48 related protein [Paraclostridium sp.]